MNQTNQTINQTLKAVEEQWLFLLIGILAISLALFQIWQTLSTGLPATYHRPLFLSWVLLLIFLTLPTIKNHNSSYYLLGRLFDSFCCLLVIFASYRIIHFDYNSIDHMLYGLKPLDLSAGLIIIVLTLEATRRSVGIVMLLIGLVFLAYSLFGHLLPDILAHRAFSFEQVTRFQVFTTSGLFGSALGIAAGVVFVYLLFGALLEVTGAGHFFINLAYIVAGKFRGGPAKASVVASALLGSISGSAIANTATSGALTIPMMKKLGYKAHQAGGIEAAASTGGQIMPPIMGAGAFIMAEFTNIPYSHIVLISIAPAILFFACTMLYVHIMACKLNLQGMKERPPLLKNLMAGAHFILPLILITTLLILNFTPELVGMIGCGAIILVACSRKHTRINIVTLFKAMKKAALLVAPISAACASAGLIVGAIGQTGLGLQFTEFIVSLSHGHLWLAVILVGFTALILGMGLPVTAAYIVIAVMAAPALTTMGLPLITAHLIIFWLSQTSNVTPPVALAAFTGAGIANASPMKTAMESFKLSQALFLIPLMMVYTPLIWVDNFTISTYVGAIVTTLALIIAVAATTEGYLFQRVKWQHRILFLLAACCLVPPIFPVRLLGLGLCLLGIVLNILKQRDALILNSADKSVN